MGRSVQYVIRCYSIFVQYVDDALSDFLDVIFIALFSAKHAELSIQHDKFPIHRDNFQDNPAAL